MFEGLVLQSRMTKCVKKFEWVIIGQTRAMYFPRPNVY